MVFGGSNCDGPMGHALHRNHPFVDHVVRGAAEHAFPTADAVRFLRECQSGGRQVAGRAVVRHRTAAPSAPAERTVQQ